MLADARLTLALTDLKADPAGWQDAARELERLRDQHAETHGQRSVLTLTLAVAHAEALIALGRPGPARRAVQAVRDDFLDRLGPEHPAALRADMVLGYAAAQFHEYAAARDHNARAGRACAMRSGPPIRTRWERSSTWPWRTRCWASPPLPGSTSATSSETPPAASDGHGSVLAGEDWCGPAAHPKRPEAEDPAAAPGGRLRTTKAAVGREPPAALIIR